MAASRPLCLCNPLCFLVSRFGKRSSKELKSAVLDFYDVEELSCAKNQLLEDVKGLEAFVNLPHIPTRRGGEDRAIHIVDDIFTVLIYLDENLSLGMLPRYVTDNLDSVPSSRLYEGDLSTLMKVIERMDNEIKDLRLALDIVVKNTQHRSLVTAPVQAAVRSVINSQPPVTAQSGCFPDAGETSIVTSGDSFPQLGNLQTADHGSERRDWATMAASSPVALHNRFSALINHNDNQNEEQFIEQRRRPNKRQRQFTEQLIQSQRQQQQQQQRSSGSQRRGRVMITGKSKSPGHTFTAAMRIPKKAVFCVDNLDISMEVNDLCRFVSSLNVRVFSCFPTNPRRRRYETEIPEDRKAFRLCIDEDDRDLLLNDTKWPESVIISEWYRLDPNTRRQQRTERMLISQSDESQSNQVSAVIENLPMSFSDNAESTLTDQEDTVLYQPGDDSGHADNQITVEHGVQ